MTDYIGKARQEIALELEWDVRMFYTRFHVEVVVDFMVDQWQYSDVVTKNEFQDRVFQLVTVGVWKEIIK